MAKAGFWLRGAKGKLAGASIGKGSQGGTVIREIVSPKNPQSLGQMIQRILWNTVIQAYAFFKPLANHSFEGFTEGAETQQQFVKHNMALIHQRLQAHTAANKSLNSFFNVTALGDSYVAYNSYLLSHGTLPQVIPSPNEAWSVFSIPANANTYQGVIDALGLQRGDQLTFVILGRSTTGGQKLYYSRVILDPMQAGVQLPLGTAFCADDAVVYPSPRNEGTFSVLRFEDGKINFDVTANGIDAMGAAVIVSREVSQGQWLRSTSYFVCPESHDLSLYDAYEMAKSGVSTQSELYLNNAGQGTQVSGSASYEPTISALTFNGMNALSQDALVQNTQSGAVTVNFTAANMTEITNPRIVAVSGTNIPEEDASVTGKGGIAISNGSGSGSLNLSEGDYRLVLIAANNATSNQGNVVAVYARVHWSTIL